ncbi:MAG: hypothetical protein V7K32_01485 [Nostoc sp.]|uniref:hypothetical protein n=1 Tax=Nostoc sp. TaxID=1180 RepID=UPI002FFCF9CE
MNQTIFTLLSSSCVLYLFVLMSHAAVAEGKPSVATITSAPAHQVAGTVASPTKSSATQTTETLVINRVYLETCSSSMMKRICPHSPTPNPRERDSGSQNFKVPLPYLGEGFRVRAKTTVLNLDEVYK